MTTPISKAEAFRRYKKKNGHHHKADPAHPMNSERTGPLKKRKPNPKKAEKKPTKNTKPDKKVRRYAKG